ncbi:MAG TPA: hypothetical protein DCX52_09425 [Massilia sp.]|nr:hypothetical protein [Massilia sp.]
MPSPVGTAPGTGPGTTPGTGGTPGTGDTPGTGTVPGAPPAVTPGGTWLALTPATVTLSAIEGESTGFRVIGTSSRTFEKPFNMAIIDSKGVVTTDVTISALSQFEYAADLRTAPALAAGSHTTNLEVRLCEDVPTVCSKPLPGSPWYIPVTVNVAPLAQAQERLTLMPAAFDLVTYQGEPLSFELVAQMAGASKPVQLAVVDNAGILAQGAVMSQDSSTTYRAKLTTSSVLTPGEHSASLEVRACYDEPRECRLPVSGSPWRVPTKVTVKSGINLTALAALPGVAPWSTYNGNATHTGYVPASFDPANFTRRWNRPETGTGFGQAVAIDRGRVFTVAGLSESKWELIAVNEADGEVAWRYHMSRLYNVNPPAAANGKVFVTSTGHEDSFLWVFDQATGQLISKTALSSQWDRYMAPTVVGDMVYTNSGAYGGMVKFNAATNLVEWRNTTLPQYDGWTPAVDGGYAYAYMNSQVYAVDTASGGIAFTIANPSGQWMGWTTSTLALDDKMGFVVHNGRLLGFDLQARARAWETNGSTIGQPIVAKGVVYSLAEGGSLVEARASTNGMLQWKSAALNNGTVEAAFMRMVVSSNLLFASSATTTVAIDLATHQVVWTYPLGGELAISDRGVLYIVARSGKLAAVNLR